VIPFLIGCVVSLVAAIPAVLLSRGSRQTSLKFRVMLWVLGVILRFGIIGAVLYYLFTQTGMARIPVVLGVVIVYILVFVIEARKTLRS
jgi:hypothetical protein